MSTSKRAAREAADDDNDNEEQEEGRNVKARLSARDQMQLKLLASIPSLQQAPLRDSTGRRRATCVSSAEMAEGLANLVASHTAVAANVAATDADADDADADDADAEHKGTKDADAKDADPVCQKQKDPDADTDPGAMQLRTTAQS